MFYHKDLSVFTETVLGSGGGISRRCDGYSHLDILLGGGEMVGMYSDTPKLS